MINNCELCSREREVTFHHLIPKETHHKSRIKNMHSKEDMNNSGIDICNDCHKYIHKIFDNVTLATQFYTKELLLANELIMKFINWVSKQNKKAKI